MRLGANLRASALQLRWSFDYLVGIAELSRFLPAPFQISERAAGEAAEFRRSGVELLGMIGAARFECGKPAAEAGELIGRQLGNRLGDFFDLHVAQYSRSGLGFACPSAGPRQETTFGSPCPSIPTKHPQKAAGTTSIFVSKNKYLVKAPSRF